MILAAAIAWGASPIERAQQAELERLRTRVGDEVQLGAYDLVDELVYGWLADPPFAVPTPVVLAGVTVPVGLGSGMQALLENHVADVLVRNPLSNVELVHCPSCVAVVVHSGPDATVVSRGIDDPAVLAELGTGTGRHALFLDIEAEGTFLVLRARLTRLTPDLPIVWSHTIATSASTPALLRDPDHLTSAAEAREEYLDALRDRGPISVPLRVAIRSYAPPEDFNSGTPPPPFLWVETGVELGATRAQDWTFALLAGYSFIPQAYQGILAQGRVNRLVTGLARSHSRPDLYVFAGAAAITVWGPATASFANERIDADQVIQGYVDPLTGEPLAGPRTSFGAIQVGLDLRLGHRMGVSTFLETLPSLASSRNLGDHVRVFGISWQTFGTEATFWF